MNFQGGPGDFSLDMLRKFQRKGQPDGFEQFDASVLYCPKCKQPMPVRKKLLLVLPSGDYYNLVCAKCGTSLGKKLE